MANPIVTIEMESGAVMSGELYPEIAPNTVNNFIALANSGFYDGVVFHRVIPGFMIQGGDPALCISVYHDGEYKEADVDVEIQKTVKGTYPDTEHVKFKTIPPVTVASATFQGPYRQIGEVNQAVASWVEDNGYAFDGLFFNIYHVSPHETRNPEEFVTEVCYPVRKR